MGKIKGVTLLRVGKIKGVTLLVRIFSLVTREQTREGLLVDSHVR